MSRRTPSSLLPPTRLPDAGTATARVVALCAALLAAGACSAPGFQFSQVAPANHAAPALTNSGELVSLSGPISDTLDTGPVHPARYYTQGPYSWAWQVGLPRNRLVLYYGNPLSPVLGPIGRYPDAELVARLRQQAATYDGLDPAHRTVPGFDYVTPVAQPDPQKDGTYTLRMPDESVKHYVELARQNHLLFFFDLQIGHSTVAREVDHLWPYVELPWVNLSLDPEFDMAPGDIPGVEFGRMYAAEINAVIDRLSNLVATENLPPKVLIVHWFRPGLIPDWQNVRLKPGVSVITSDDGVGPPGPKIDDYDIYDREDLIQYPGIKIFYELDKPLMTEAEVVRLTPSPVMVMYQ